MFFVSVGSIDKPFTRLLDAINALPSTYLKKVIYQGYVKNPKIYNFTILNYMSRNEYLEYLQKSELVIIHCGIGTIYECASLGKKTIIIPRMSKYEEHNNDHQLEIFKKLNENPIPNIYPLSTFNDLEITINHILSQKLISKKFYSSIVNLKEQVQKDVSNCLKT